MRIGTEARSTETFGTTASTNFSIAANGKAFKILMDGLYADKELAIVRELWTNAYDSHLAAGNADTPFLCHIPTTWEPWFSVRDYGVGMSHEYMMGGYTRVFHSTKDNSNDQVGALGLGRMSPFAKVDTFTVTTWVGGIQSTYSVFLDDNRIPTITLLGALPSDERSGVEINLPVENKDFNAFKQAALTCAIGFDVLPVINSIKLTPPTILMQGNGWKMVKRTDDLRYMSGAYARQGCVVYPINRNALAVRLSNAQSNILSAHIVIDFPIGELDIAANREALSYDAMTQTNIIARLDNIIAEVIAGFKTQIDTAPSMWHARRLQNKLISEHSYVATVLEHNTKWRGRRIETYTRLDDELARSNTTLSACVYSPYDMTTENRRGRGKIEHAPVRYCSVKPEGTIVVFEDRDSPVSLPGSRLRHWYRNTSEAHGMNVLWLRGKKDYAFKRVIARLGRPDVHDLNAMPLPPKDPSTIKRTKTLMKVYDPAQGTRSETTVIEEDGAVYVDVFRDRIIGADGNDVSIPNLYAVVKKMIEVKALPDDFKLILVPATHARVPKRNPDTWVTLWAKVKETLDTRFDLDALVLAHQYREMTRERSSMADLARDILTLSPDLAVFDADEKFSPMVSLCRYYALAATRTEASVETNTLADIYRITYGKSPILTDPGVVARLFEAKKTRAKQAYPLISYIFEEDLNQNLLAQLAEYVNLIDDRTVKAHITSTMMLPTA